MKFSCLQENLNKGIQIVTRAIPTKSALPILSNILISAEKNTLKLAATNMETTIITHIGASIESEGSITVPAKIFKDFVSNLSPSTVNVQVTNDVIHVSSEKTKTKFNGTNAQDYPDLPEIDKEMNYLELDPKEFANAVSMVSFASGNDESRPMFTGVLIKNLKESILLASSDGFRLSEKTLKTNNEYPEFTIVVPAKTLIEVAKIFSNSEEPLRLGVNENENQAVFYSESTFISTRILEGEFPEYKKIIPVDIVLSVDLPSVEFSEAVKLSNIFTSDNDSALRIKFDPDGVIKIASVAAETGEHESSVTGDVEGETLEITFNPKYLLDFLNNVKTERIKFFAKANTSPCLFKSDEHENFIHIIMPIMKA